MACTYTAFLCLLVLENSHRIMTVDYTMSVPYSCRLRGGCVHDSGTLVRTLFRVQDEGHRIMIVDSVAFASSAAMSTPLHAVALFIDSHSPHPLAAAAVRTILALLVVSAFISAGTILFFNLKRTQCFKHSD